MIKLYPVKIDGYDDLDDLIFVLEMIELGGAA